VHAFLVPLVAGFGFNAASAFTAAYSERWGERRGRLITAVLRNVLGIPVWVIGLVLAVRTPSPALFIPNQVATAIGWLLLLLGSLVQVLALAALRQRAALPTTRDTLVQHGPYAQVRHPIYAGLLLEFAAISLVKPTWATVLACGLGALWVLLQARLEEVDLLRRLPPYSEYMSRVPRFLPHLGRRR
jgi:protein-S-isoprenylcysteine O-methyltransferase Ste14